MSEQSNNSVPVQHNVKYQQTGDGHKYNKAGQKRNFPIGCQFV